MPSFGISKRIFPAAISSRATVTGLPESTSTIGNAPSFNCRARLAATITSAYLFSTRSSSASRGGLITCRHPRWEGGRSLRTTSYCNSAGSGVKRDAIRVLRQTDPLPLFEEGDIATFVISTCTGEPGGTLGTGTRRAAME